MPTSTGRSLREGSRPKSSSARSGATTPACGPRSRRAASCGTGSTLSTWNLGFGRAMSSRFTLPMGEVDRERPTEPSSALLGGCDAPLGGPRTRGGRALRGPSATRPDYGGSRDGARLRSPPRARAGAIEGTRGNGAATFRRGAGRALASGRACPRRGCLGPGRGGVRTPRRGVRGGPLPDRGDQNVGPAVEDGASTTRASTATTPSPA